MRRALELGSGIACSLTRRDSTGRKSRENRKDHGSSRGNQGGRIQEPLSPTNSVCHDIWLRAQAPSGFCIPTTGLVVPEGSSTMWSCGIGLGTAPSPKERECRCGEEKNCLSCCPFPTRELLLPITMSPNAITSWDNNPATTLRRRRRPH